MPTRIDALVHLTKIVGATARIHHQPARRRVSFQQTELDTSDDVPRRGSAFTPQERNTLWYHPMDLVGFKIEAREISRRIRRNSSSFDDARGLEHRISMERQKNKILAIRAILKAQDLHSPQELARIASRCTAWAKEVALLAGSKDYYTAYNPELAHLVPTTPSMPRPLASGMKKKRPAEVIVIDDDEQQEQVRRTRPRLSMQHSSPRRVGFVTAR